MKKVVILFSILMGILVTGAIHLVVFETISAQNNSNSINSEIDDISQLEDPVLFEPPVEEPVTDPVEIPTEEPSKDQWEESNDPDTDSPEIFFHVTEPVITEVSVTIPKGVTLTIPDVSMGAKATWEDVYIGEDGTVLFEGEKYPYLYYEGIFSYPESNYGWLVQQVDGKLLLDGKLINQEILIAFLENKFLGSELYENEAKVIINRILDYNMLEFSKPYLVIRYIPMEDVDKTMQLETSQPFSMMRRHFWVEERDEQIELQEPIFEIIENSGYVIHETAVNKKHQ